MNNPPIQSFTPPEEESSWEIERQTKAFLQKLIELNRKLQNEEKEEKLKMDDDLTGR